MTVAGVALTSFGCGFVACFLLLVEPQRRLLKRWLAFYADDIKDAKNRRVPPDRKGSQ